MASGPEEPVDAAEIPVEKDQQNQQQGLCRNMSSIKLLGKVEILDYSKVVFNLDLLAVLFQIERLFFKVLNICWFFYQYVCKKLFFAIADF